MQREFQVTYFANNNIWRYVYCSCIFKAWQLLNDNSFYSHITHQFNIVQSASVKIKYIIIMWLKIKNEVTKLNNGVTIMEAVIS